MIFLRLRGNNSYLYIKLSFNFFISLFKIHFTILQELFFHKSIKQHWIKKYKNVFQYLHKAGDMHQLSRVLKITRKVRLC